MDKEELRIIENGIRDFIKEELGEYPYYEDFSLTHEHENVFNLEVTNAKNIVVFRGTIRAEEDCQHATDEVKIEVKLTEDSWFEVYFFDWTVKYFWMALLQS